MTLVEVAVVSVIMLVILIPIMTLFSRSVELTYVGDQESTAQKEVSHGMYLVGQDIQKTLSFVDINTTLNRFSCWIYDSVGTGSTMIGYYRASDKTLRRISNYSGSYSGGEIISRYVTSLNCTFRTDTLYNLTSDPTKVAAVFVQIGVGIPGKTYSAFTANSSWWSRNIRTL
jgi:hypothetical protein